MLNFISESYWGICYQINSWITIITFLIHPIVVIISISAFKQIYSWVNTSKENKQVFNQLAECQEMSTDHT